MNDSWGSPLWLVRRLEDRFGPITLDAAAEKWSAVAPYFVTQRQNVFRCPPPTRHAYLNPPYSRGNLGRFVPHARDLVVRGHWRACTLLVPHYTSEGWWRHVVRPEGRARGAQWRFGELPSPLSQWVTLKSAGLEVDIIEVAERLKFRTPPTWRGQGGESARYASVVVRFSRGCR